MQDYTSYDAIGLAELVSTGNVSAQELVFEALERAHIAQDSYNCFSAIWDEFANTQLNDADLTGPFAGVPFAVKDLNMPVSGLSLTNGSRSFSGSICQADGELVQRFKKAGLILIGQTTSPEFGLTSTTESKLYGATTNPWNTAKTSGGSSGGASSTVAAGVMPMAHASDGGGSIRIPAACTGLFGMKPSRGRIPMGPDRTEGWNGLSTSFAVSRSVRDSAALMDAVHGLEPAARYTAPVPAASFLSATQHDPQSLKVAVWAFQPTGGDLHPEAIEGVDRTRRLLESLGHTTKVVADPFDREALGKAQLTAISGNIASVITHREAVRGSKITEDDVETVTWRMFELGKSMPAMMMADADSAFMTAALVLHQLFETYDVVLAPTITRPPDDIGVLSLSPSNFDDYAQAVTSFASHCGVFNQTGAPAMSVPLHWTKDNLPLGMMFGAPYGREDLLFSLAAQLERAQPWFNKTVF